MYCHPAPRSRGTFAEAFVALIALAGYVVPVAMGRTVSLVSYMALLGVIVLCYFLLLFARSEDDECCDDGCCDEEEGQK
ncbi:MAG: hypothetical protein PHW10_01710 [Candidatus Peribacteraceae bacterium]|nr:hypothetical protein [Candidatus Peribacteraceae bacterium]